MTYPKLFLIEPSESIRSLVKWTVGDEFSVVDGAPTLESLDASGDIAIVLTSVVDKGFLEKVKQRQIPTVIMLYGDDLPLYETQIRLGDYLVKPFHPQDLLFRLRRQLKPVQSPIHVLAFDPAGWVSADMAPALARLGIVWESFNQDKPLLNRLKEFTPDVIVSDAALPAHNAQILLDAVQIAQIPLIGLFANQDQIENSVFYDAGCDYLVAPVTDRSLLLRLKYILKKKIGVTAPLPERSAEDASVSLSPDLMAQVNVTLNHEIRSPLTSILIGAQVLQKRSAATSQEYQIAREIEDASRRIQGTLDNFGSMKRIVVDDYVNGVTMLNLKRSVVSEAVLA